MFCNYDEFKFFRGIQTHFKLCRKAIQALLTSPKQTYFPLPLYEELSFSAWNLDSDGNYYQGETDEAGLPHGRGILLRPNIMLHIGYFKHSLLHGPGV